MSAYTKIARPYAKAVFEYALAASDITSWNSFLQKASMIVKDKQIPELLQNPNIDSSKKLELITQLTNPEEKAQQNLLKVLAKHQRLLIIPSLSELFKQLVRQHDNIVDVTVTTAFGLSKDLQQKLQEALKIRLGKHVNFTIIEDKKLLGGAIIQAEDFVMDGSIQGKLKRLKKLLVN